MPHLVTTQNKEWQGHDHDFTNQACSGKDSHSISLRKVYARNRRVQIAALALFQGPHVFFMSFCLSYVRMP